VKVAPLSACRICGNADLEQVLDLGVLALTGVFPRTVTESVTEGPLRLLRCKGSCGLVQLAHTYDLGELYGDQYGYRSGLNASMVAHLRAKVAALVQRRPLEAGEVVLDIGSNDGTTLSAYPSASVRIGIDPTTEKFRRFHPPGLTAVADFFSARRFFEASGGKKAAIVTSISMFYDLPAPMEFVRDVAEVLADDGIWHLEQSYLPTMLERRAYDTVCHEHLEYYGLAQLQWMTSRCGLRIAQVELNDVNGGSFAVTVTKGSGDAPQVQALLAAEETRLTPQRFQDFAAAVDQHRAALPARLSALKAQGKRVFGLGASTKGNVVLQACGIGPQLLPAIGEVNPDKLGCFTPGTKIPIQSEEALKQERPDVFLVLPWHFRPGFLERERPFLASGGRLLFPLPEIELV
jgi:NDP-4-keto-2,6-dideoxyhexose 3-C-methyltransferase